MVGGSAAPGNIAGVGASSGHHRWRRIGYRGSQSWYQEQAGLGSAVIACIGKQLEFIELQPLAAAVVAHGIRRSVVPRFPYNIYYAVNGEFINILAVWHGNRDQAQLLSRLDELGSD